MQVAASRGVAPNFPPGGATDRGHYFDGFYRLSKSENGIGCFP